MRLCRRGHDRDVVGDYVLRGKVIMCAACKKENNDRLNPHFNATIQSRNSKWRYMLKHREKYRQRGREYYEKNRDKMLAYGRERYRKIRAAGGPYMYFWMQQVKESL